MAVFHNKEITNADGADVTMIVRGQILLNQIKTE